MSCYFNSAAQRQGCISNCPNVIPVLSVCPNQHWGTLSRVTPVFTHRSIISHQAKTEMGLNQGDFFNRKGGCCSASGLGVR